MRNIFEKYGFDLFELSPLHSPGNVFHSTAGLHPHATAAATPITPPSAAVPESLHSTTESHPPSTVITSAAHGADLGNDSAAGSSSGDQQSSQPLGGQSERDSSSSSPALTDSAQGPEEDADGECW